MAAPRHSAIAIPPAVPSSFRRLSSSPSRLIPVVCAIVTDAAGRVLVAQRPPHKHLGLKWEFPGGKVEPREEPAAALLREIREELGCTLADLRALPRFTHDYGFVAIEMIPFICRLAADSPTPHAHEHVALRWVTPVELRDGTLDLSLADVPLLAQLADAAPTAPPDR